MSPSALHVSSLVALLGLLALLLGCAAMYREARHARRREAAIAQERAELTAAYGQLEIAKRRAEAETHHLNATLSGMSDGVMMLDSEFRLVQWNANFPLFSGIPQSMLRVGLPMEEMIRAQALIGELGTFETPALLEAEVKRRMARVRGHRNTDVTERLRPDGRVLETRRRALPDGGLVTLYTDISMRRQAEAAQREVLRLSEVAVEQKAQFVAMVSHEIRVPLSAVTSSLSLLDQSALSEQQRLHVDTARQAGDTLLDLINDILDLSKMDAGQLQLRRADFALRPMLQGVRDMFHVQARARDISIGLEVADDVPVLLHADSGRLRQVLMNFVSNAVKFSRPGTVTLRVEKVFREAGAGPHDRAAAQAERAAGRGQAGRVQACLRLAVCDQGPRIPAEQAELVYQPFARLDYAKEAGLPGTGLGLTICRQLALLMGGSLGLDVAECDDGQADGNAFWLELALADFTAPAAASTAPIAEMFGLVPRLPRRASVLLVEDIATNRVLIAALLRREGHRVEAVELGEQAIEIVGRRPFDVVFMDLNMPGLDGRSTAVRIRGLPGLAGRVPIVALTATDRDAVLEACLAAGMNEVLTKPVRTAELFDMLDRMVRPVAPLPIVVPPAPRIAPPVAEGSPAAPALPPVLSFSDLPPVASAGPESGLLDSDRLLDLQRGLPAGLFGSLVEQCLDDIAARLARLHQALLDGETVAIVGIAHALAGMSGSYGLAALERRMRTIMHAADVGDLETANAAARGMAGELERSAKLVRALLQAQPV